MGIEWRIIVPHVVFAKQIKIQIAQPNYNNILIIYPMHMNAPKIQFVIDATYSSFQIEILQASQNIPVLVNFGAPWCEPCQLMQPLLVGLANQQNYHGRFILANVNADDEPEICAAFDVQSLPTCVLLMNEQPIDGFKGALEKADLEAFLNRHLPEKMPSSTNPVLDVQSDTQLQTPTPTPTPKEQLQLYTQALKDEPKNEVLRFNLVKLLLDLGQHDDAKIAFAPVINQTQLVQHFASLQHWMNAIDLAFTQPIDEEGVSALLVHLTNNKRDFDAHFRLAQHHMSQQNWISAMDALSEILMRDKVWQTGLARKNYIAILDVASGLDASTNTHYRRRLSSLVLS